MPINRKPQGKGGGQYSQGGRPDDPSDNIDDDSPVAIAPAGAWSADQDQRFVPEWTPDREDPRFPPSVDQFTEDFGGCPCGKGQMESDESNNDAELQEEGYFLVHNTVRCSDSGDILADSTFASPWEESGGGLTEGEIDWHSRCTNTPEWPGPAPTAA